MPLYELQKGHFLQLSQLLTLFSLTLLFNTVDRVLMLKRQQTNHEGRLTHNINFTEASYDIYMEQATGAVCIQTEYLCFCCLSSTYIFFRGVLILMNTLATQRLFDLAIWLSHL